MLASFLFSRRMLSTTTRTRFNALGRSSKSAAEAGPSTSSTSGATTATDAFNPEAGHRPVPGTLSERTMLAVKPDGVQRGLVGEVISRVERRGLKLCGLKVVNPTRTLAEAHYAEHRGRPFFERVCRFMCSGPVVAMVVEGNGAIGAVRRMCGPTDPLQADAGTVRGDLGVHFRRNIVHSSDSEESARDEIALWFHPEEVVSWDQATAHWVAELPTADIQFRGEAEHPGFLAGPPDVRNEELPFAGGSSSD